MASRINYQNNVITANKFVPIGGNTIGSKEKLNSIRQTLGNKEQEFDTKELESLFNDNLLTSEEKIKLRDRWQFLSLAYDRLKNDIISAFGEDGLSGYSDMNNLRNDIDYMLSVVLANIDEPSKPPAELEPKITEFSIKYNELSQAYSAGLMEILSYEITISSNKASYFDNDTITVVPVIKKDGVIKDPKDFELTWNFSKEIDFTENVDKSISFKASEYDDKLDISCNLTVNITNSLSS